MVVVAVLMMVMVMVVMLCYVKLWHDDAGAVRPAAVYCGATGAVRRTVAPRALPVLCLVVLYSFRMLYSEALSLSYILNRATAYSNSASDLQVNNSSANSLFTISFIISAQLLFQLTPMLSTPFHLLEEMC